MSERGFTQQQIAKVLGVSQNTVARDLAEVDLSTVDKSKHTKTATNPRGAGRPKGTKAKRARPAEDKARAAVSERVRNGEPVKAKEVAAEIGVSHVIVEQAAAIERAQHEEPQIDASTLSMSAQEKLATAIRVHKARLDREFEHRVETEVRKRIAAADDFVREDNKRLRQTIHHLESVASPHAVFTKTQFRQLQMLCHPDNSASEQTRAELSRLLIANEQRLVRRES